MNPWDMVKDKRMYMLHVKIAIAGIKQDKITSDDVRKAMRVFPLVPNWFGIAFRWGAKALGYAQTGEYRKSTQKSRRGGAIAVWQKGGASVAH